MILPRPQEILFLIKLFWMTQTHKRILTVSVSHACIRLVCSNDCIMCIGPMQFVVDSRLGEVPPYWPYLLYCTIRHVGACDIPYALAAKTVP